MGLPVVGRCMVVVWLQERDRKLGRPGNGRPYERLALLAGLWLSWDCWLHGPLGVPAAAVEPMGAAPGELPQNYPVEDSRLQPDFVLRYTGIGNFCPRWGV